MHMHALPVGILPVVSQQLCRLRLSISKHIWLADVLYQTSMADLYM